MEFVIASHNTNKINEIKKILPEYKFIFSPKTINLECIEIGKTFLQNAYLKAKTIFNITKLPCIADDSGLEIKAMNNLPGVYSSRYKKSICKNDSERNLIILNYMKNKVNREARFVCCIALINDKKNIHFFHGYCYGNISKKIKGNNGFSYDSIFIPNGYSQTLAELESNIKNKISHRYNALLKLKMFLYEKN